MEFLKSLKQFFTFQILLSLGVLVLVDVKLGLTSRPRPPRLRAKSDFCRSFDGKLTARVGDHKERRNFALSFGGLHVRIGFLDARRRVPGRHGIWRQAAGLCCRPGIEDRGDSQYTGARCVYCLCPSRGRCSTENPVAIHVAQVAMVGVEQREAAGDSFCAYSGTAAL